MSRQKKKPANVNVHSLASALNAAEQLLEKKHSHEAIIQLHPYLNALEASANRPSPKSQQHDQAKLYYTYACALQQQGDTPSAIKYLKKLLAINYQHKLGRRLLIDMLISSSLLDEALEQTEISITQEPELVNPLVQKALILSLLKRYDECAELWEKLLAKQSDIATFWSNAGNVWRDIGQLDKAIEYYKNALSCKDDHQTAFSNLLTILHYHPDYNAQQILNTAKQWQQMYAPSTAPNLNHNNSLSPEKKIKIGMFSDGFRTHPVGLMITSVLESLPHSELELYLYSTNTAEDIITKQLKKAAHQWLTITHLNDAEFAEQIRNDGIDLLFDLCGHNTGSRMQVMLEKPAPIQIKWVGGLISSTGISTIDYLLSDHIETPTGADDLYTESLIRMPDDYICYNPPLYTPDLTAPPATYNGHITLGCFNNPTKINTVLLEQWATILHSLPDSKLLLKGFQFSSQSLQDNVISTLTKHGISTQRVIIEGPSYHEDLLKTYNKIDIALDPWPYSGGLTTCEALFMGVPVVTLPGPTFAGRHSATHLTNVGLGQLVAEDWQQYHDIVVNLASDLGNLANIRTHLRSALLESPVCDAPRFARNFSNAMRAIWQRHCEGKAPAALSLDKDGNAQFKDENESVTLQFPEEPITVADNEFSFNFTGRINALEHGATLASRSDFGQFLTQGAVNYICLDPGSVITNSQQLQHIGLFEYFPLTVLGNGSQLELKLAVEATQSTTLPITDDSNIQLISTTQVASYRLNDINGLDSLDWLILDGQHNNVRILENGQQKLSSVLLLEVNTCEHADYVDQLGLTAITKLAQQQGLTLLKVNPAAESNQAIFIPNQQILAKLDNNQLMKLAFLLDAVYSDQDTVALLLKQADKSLANRYLTSKEKQDAPASLAKQNSFSLPNAPAMTDAEQQLFLRHLKQSKRYFEFGSGGSTVWAVEQGLTVNGVESDPTWVNALQEKLGEPCQVEVVDIGPTGDWGYPLEMAHSDKFPRYSQAILEHDQPFDLILIDGRFRVACTMAAIQHIAKYQTQDSTLIFIHDFWNRPQYHCVLDFLIFEGQVDSAGIFKIKKDVELKEVSDMWLRYSINPE